MNFIDIVFFVFIVLAVFRGFRKGFIVEFFTFLSIFLGIYSAIYFLDTVIEILNEKGGISFHYLPILSFIIIFLIVGAVVYFGGIVFQKFISLVQLGLLNRILGVLFSILKIILLFGFLIYLLESYDQKGKYIPDKIKAQSLVYLPIHKIMKMLIPSFEESYLFFEQKLTSLDESTL